MMRYPLMPMFREARFVGGRKRTTRSTRRKLRGGRVTRRPRRTIRRMRGGNIFKKMWSGMKTAGRAISNPFRSAFKTYYPGLRDKAMNYARSQADIYVPQVKAYANQQLDKAKDQATAYAQQQAQKAKQYAQEKAMQARNYALEKAEQAKQYAENKMKSLTGATLTGTGKRRRRTTYRRRTLTGIRRKRRTTYRRRTLRGKGIFGDILKGVKSVGKTAFNIVKAPAELAIKTVAAPIVQGAVTSFLGGRKRRVVKRRVVKRRRQRGGFGLSALLAPFAVGAVRKLTGLVRKRKVVRKTKLKRKQRGGMARMLASAVLRTIANKHKDPKMRTRLEQSIARHNL